MCSVRNVTKTIDEKRKNFTTSREGLLKARGRPSLLPDSIDGREGAYIALRCFIDRRNGGEGGWLRCIQTESEIRRAHNVFPRQLPGKLCNAAIYLGQIDNL